MILELECEPSVRIVVDGDVTGDAVEYDSYAAHEPDLEPDPELEEKGVVRRVRTAAGARLFGQPIGSIIKPDAPQLPPMAVVNKPGEGGYRRYPKHWWGFRDAVKRGASLQELIQLAGGNQQDLLDALQTMHGEGVLTDEELGRSPGLPPMAGEAAAAKKAVKSVADLVAEGWDPEKAVKEHKRLVHNEAVRLIRLRQKQEKEAAKAKDLDLTGDSSVTPALLEKLEKVLGDSKPSELDPKVLEDLADGGESPNPKALYTLAGSGVTKGGPGAVTGGAWWRRLKHDTISSDGVSAPGVDANAVPVVDLDLGVVGKRVDNGLAVRYRGIAYLIELEPGATELSPQERARLTQACQTVDAVMQHVPEGKRHYLGGVTLLRGSSPSDAYWAIKYDKPGFTSNATGGNGSINFWNSQDFSRPDPGTIAHEFGHNLDARAREDVADDGKWLSEAAFTDPGIAGQTKDWKLAGFDDAANIQHLAQWDFVETRPGTHKIDFATTSGMTDYADNDPKEEFAESVRLYLKDRREGKLGYLKKLNSVGGETPFNPQTMDRVNVRFADLWPNRARILDAAFETTSQYEATPYYKAKVQVAHRKAFEHLENTSGTPPTAATFAAKHQIPLDEAVDIITVAEADYKEKKYQTYLASVSQVKKSVAALADQWLTQDPGVVINENFKQHLADDIAATNPPEVTYADIEAAVYDLTPQLNERRNEVLKAAIADKLVAKWRAEYDQDPEAYEPPEYVMAGDLIGLHTFQQVPGDVEVDAADLAFAKWTALHAKLQAEQELVKSASEAAASATMMLTDADLEKDVKKKLLKKKAAVKFYAKKGGASPEDAQKAADEYYAAAVAEALEQQGVDVGTYKQAEAATQVSAGGEKFQPVHKAGAVTRGMTWLNKAGMKIHPLSKHQGQNWWGRDQRAKDNLVTELSDRLNNPADWEIYREYRRNADHFDGVGYGGPKKQLLKEFKEYTEEERRELLYDDVNNRIAKWAGTSGDSDIYALMMQHAIKDEFGLKADWGARMLVQGAGHGQAQEELLKKVTTGYAIAGPYYRRFVRHMWQHTQEEFAKEGITEVGLWRGMSTHGLPWGEPGKQRPPLQPANSWASSKAQAKKFLGSQNPRFLKAMVPVSRVLGSARTGFGCLNEAEFVVLDSDGLVQVIKPANYYS